MLHDKRDDLRITLTLRDVAQAWFDAPAERFDAPLCEIDGMLAVGRPDREDPLGVLDRPAALGNGVQTCRDRSKGAVVTSLHECLEPVEQELDLAGRLPVGACLDQGVGCFSVIRHQFPAPAQQWQRAPVAE
ncbi:MAG: hypothetical protein DCC58_18155, partial [Chloroflexi bacterium]